MKTSALEIVFYTTALGKQPFVEWLEGLSTKVEAVVLARVARIRSGNLGDCKPIKSCAGIYELRIDFGPGYRIYFGKQGATVVVLLVGGDKGSQSRDIAKAKRYWISFKERENG
jgi:putative addiction module killer protein